MPKPAPIKVVRRHPTKTKDDFAVSNHGSIFLLKPITPAAIKWVECCIGADNGFQPYYPTAIIEPRFMDDVLVGIRNLGLVAR
jgi:hypothetical protein